MSDKHEKIVELFSKDLVELMLKHNIQKIEMVKRSGYIQLIEKENSQLAIELQNVQFTMM